MTITFINSTINIKKFKVCSFLFSVVFLPHKIEDDENSYISGQIIGL